MTKRRLLFMLGALAMAALLLGGCDIFRRARRVQAEPPPPFQSPITEVIGHPGMTLPQITEALGARQADTRSILGVLTITVGEARSRSRMQLDANMYFAPPEFLRVRGSADAGTLFDFLMQGDQVQVMVVPEKKVHIGNLAGLRANQNLMGGIQPDDLMYSFLVEQNLYRQLQVPGAAQLREDKDHFVISVTYSTGIREDFSLRMTDLLVDRIDRFQARRLLGSVRFDGYAFFPAATGKSKAQHLLPTRFEAQLPNGGVATVETHELQPNAPRTKPLTVMDIPPDFQQIRL